MTTSRESGRSQAERENPAGPEDGADPEIIWANFPFRGKYYV